MLAGEAGAGAAYLNGRPERALVQLNNLKKRSDLDYYARARIEARIAAITPVVLELRRQGIRDPDLDRSEEHTSELQSLMRISYAVFCLKKKNTQNSQT